jgi:hypothetical protein
LKPVQAKLEALPQKQKRAGGVAQEIEPFPSMLQDFGSIGSGGGRGRRLGRATRQCLLGVGNRAGNKILQSVDSSKHPSQAGKKTKAHCKIMKRGQ